MDYRLQEVLPVDVPTVSSPLGYAYRHNVFNRENQDEVQAIGQYLFLDLRGRHSANSADDVSNSFVEYIVDHFWPEVFSRWVEMAQFRDGYNPSTTSLTTADVVRQRLELILTLKINIRVLWALFHCTAYNEATRSMRTAFSGKRSRMENLLKWSNTLIYPQEWDDFISYWSAVCVPYPGGPILYNLFSFQGLTTDPKTGTYTDWGADDLPELETSADIGYLLDDIQLALTEVDSYNINTAARKVDFQLVQYHLKMLNFPIPATPARGLCVSPKHFEDIIRCGFAFTDNQGAGNNICVFHPDIAGDKDTLIQQWNRQPMDALDWAGMKYMYAFDNPDTANTWMDVDASEKLMTYGVVRPGHVSTNLHPLWLRRLYTAEDGWYEPSNNEDATSAAGLQAFLWSHPLVTAHPNSFKFIAKEETEEDYRMNFVLDSRQVWEMPFDHFGESYARYLHGVHRVPFIK
jgi:hypothetical protein